MPSLFLFMGNSLLQVHADTSSDTSNVDGENLVSQSLIFNIAPEVGHNELWSFQMSLPKAREWIVSAARANYQELSKLAKDENKLVRIQVSPS